MQGFEKIEYILESFLGAPKNGNDGAQRQYNCPCCTQENGGIPDNKYNLEVNLLSGVYNCWKCGESNGTKGNLGTLVKRYGGRNLYKQYKEEIAVLIKTKLYQLEDTANLGIVKEKERLHLPSTYKKIDLSKYCKQSVREYLEKRNIDQEIIDKFNIGYTEWEKEDNMHNWSYRLIIPSYDSVGDLNFFVGRDYLPPEEQNPKFFRPKYLNVVAEKKEIIFQESLVDWDAPIYLCEGAIDCIYPPNAIALLGKRLEDDSYLYKTIREKANAEIIVCLDNDTDISEVKSIYKMLDYGRLRGKIWYIRSDKYKDFGEVFESGGKKEMIKLFKTAKQFTESELII